MIEKIESHVQDALNRQITQFSEAKLLNTLIEIGAQRMQSAEDVLNLMLNGTALSNATGATLDILGEIYGEEGERQGLSDDEYRSYLIALSIKLRSGGEHNSILAAIRVLVLSEAPEIYFISTTRYDYGHWIYYVHVTDPFNVGNRDIIQARIQEIAAAGVRLDVVLTDAESYFNFSESLSEAEGFQTIYLE
jgi:hypothetical protein